MEIILVRHAQPAWDVDGISQPDPDLTELGRVQAERLGMRLAEQIRPDAELIVSPAVRSIQTIEPLAMKTGTSPAVIPNLVELKMPDWSETPTEQVEQAFRDAYHRPPEQWWDGMPGGESFRDFHDRITTAMVDLLAERSVVPLGGHLEGHLWKVGDENAQVVLVGHAGTNALALGFLLGLEPTPWEWERFVLGHASIARVTTFPLGGAQIFSMRAFNDMEHLDLDQRTR